MTISSQTLSMPLPPEDADMTCEEGRLFISSHSTKPWNDPKRNWRRVWFLLNPDQLAISTWSLTINQQPLW